MLAGLALLVGAGCGGGDKSTGDRTFEADGIGITFRYPATFKPVGKVTFSQSAGAQPKARAGVRLDRVNVIVVSRYDLRAKVTRKNLANFKPEVDGVIGRLAGRRIAGRKVEYGGLPGYEYVISLKSPPNGRSRLAVLFDDATEYLVNCQSTPEKRQAVAAACRQALDTLERK